jgi:hypothetical protein
MAGVLKSFFCVNQRLKGPVSKEGSGACGSHVSADEAGCKMPDTIRCFDNAMTFNTAPERTPVQGNDITKRGITN